MVAGQSGNQVGFGVGGFGSLTGTLNGRAVNLYTTYTDSTTLYLWLNGAPPTTTLTLSVAQADVVLLAIAITPAQWLNILGPEVTLEVGAFNFINGQTYQLKLV
jgi:hypothetical protein